jgi:hypothetical protein
LQLRAIAIVYVGPGRRPDFNSDYFFSPIVAPREILAKLPPISIICGEQDPLVDDTVLFAARVREARNVKQSSDIYVEEEDEDEHAAVRVRLVKGLSHGFLQISSLVPEARGAISCCAIWLSELFELGDASRREYAEQHDKEWSKQWLKRSELMKRRTRMLITSINGDDDGHTTG